MVVVMAPDATDEDVERVVARVESVGGEAFVSSGVTRTIIGLVGDIDSFHGLNLRSMPGRRATCTGSPPPTSWSAASTTRRRRPSGSARGCRSGPDTFTLIAGPCAVETPQQTLEAAEMAKAAGATLLRGGAYKPRTSPYAFQGLGEAGLRDPRRRARGDRPAGRHRGRRRRATSTVVAEHADMLQVGTRNMPNFGAAAGGRRVPASRCCSSAA